VNPCLGGAIWKHAEVTSAAVVGQIGKADSNLVMHFLELTGLVADIFK
jgi:hypothetical protein